jgi:copper chaperone NosL
MAVGTDAGTGPTTSETPLPDGVAERAARLGVGLAAAVLVLLALRLPVWEARLSAPQYPAGLRITAYGHRVVGDLREINELNHYVGMEAFDPSDVPETRLWPLAVGAALAGVVLGSLLARQALGRLVRLGLWFVPLGALADVQFRLYQYGHSVDPGAPIRLEPFTPLVVGPTKVLNFTTWAYPGGAIWCLAGAAALVTFGPGVVRRARGRLGSRGGAEG